MSKYSRNQLLISSNPLTLSPTHICCCHPKFKPALLKHPKFDPTCPSHKHGTCKAFSILIGSNSSFPLKAKSLSVTFELTDEVPGNAPQSTIQEKKIKLLVEFADFLCANILTMTRSHWCDFTVVQGKKPGHSQLS